MPSPRIYRFDGITLDTAAMRLSRGPDDLALEPKSFRLLQFLIENRERVLGKEEIFRVVWEETAVSDNALTRAIAQIRKVLEDDPKSPLYIETVQTVGYRFIGVLASEGTEPAQPKNSKPGILIWASLGAVALVVFVAIGFAVWHHSRPGALEIETLPAVPFTTYRGGEDLPSFSPDGNQVAFQWDGESEDNLDIYIKTLGPDAAPLRLTTDPAPDRWPSWSPDGRTIAFQRAISSDKMALMLIPALGGPERKLAEFPMAVDPRRFKPVWSPDSRWLIVPESAGEVAALFRVSAETGESVQITKTEGAYEDFAPAISPDGKTLLFIRHLPYFWGALYSVSLDENAMPSQAPRPLPTGELPLLGVAWMPDGKEFLAITPIATVRIPAAGSNEPRPIQAIGYNPGALDLSRQGNRMIYSVVNGDGNVWRIDLTQKTPKPELLIGSTARDAYPQYSPDGKRLAFFSRRSGLGEVWISDAEGKHARQLTFTKLKRLASTPHWSPDGQKLSFDSTETGKSQVYLTSPEGGKVIPLTHGPAVNFNATWSRDGRWMYFNSKQTGRAEVWKMPDGGGPAVQITHNGGVMGVESEDGKTLYYSKETGSGSIWRMPIAGGPEQQIANSLHRANFAVTKRGIYYMTAVSVTGHATLKLYDPANGSTTTLLTIGYPEYGLDVSPDGRYLLYAQIDNPASDLMLVENFH